MDEISWLFGYITLLCSSHVLKWMIIWSMWFILCDLIDGDNSILLNHGWFTVIVWISELIFQGWFKDDIWWYGWTMDMDDDGRMMHYLWMIWMFDGWQFHDDGKMVDQPSWTINQHSWTSHGSLGKWGMQGNES